MTSPSVPNRQPSGRFGPGNSANPGGRPKMDPKVMAAFKLAAGKAVPVLLKMAQRVKPYDDISHTDQQRAISMLMDRGWGKAIQAVDMDVTGPPAVILGEPMSDEAWQAMATGARSNGHATNGANGK